MESAAVSPSVPSVTSWRVDATEARRRGRDVAPIHPVASGRDRSCGPGGARSGHRRACVLRAARTVQRPRSALRRILRRRSTTGARPGRRLVRRTHRAFRSAMEHAGIREAIDGPSGPSVVRREFPIVDRSASRSGSGSSIGSCSNSTRRRATPRRRRRSSGRPSSTSRPTAGRRFRGGPRRVSRAASRAARVLSNLDRPPISARSDPDPCRSFGSAMRGWSI